ncbi:MAG: ubiquinone biosynthesis protein UbiA, partial [Chitinophagaceae bacterium]|nr:ubiquinone biosynthesis protein UbiA [Chitinophagaceae bacterium]
GDRKFGCKTLPIVLGLNATKVFVAVWLIVLIAALVIIQFYVLQFGLVFWLSALYCVIFIVIPLIWILLKLFKAHTAQEFHKLSSVVKIVMLTGILSMLFFRFYA